MDSLKVNIEIHDIGDGRTFLNFWNSVNGDDVITEIKDGKLFWDVNEVEVECQISDFVGRVIDSYTKALEEL